MKDAQNSKQRKVVGRPFVKGDARINRGGAPPEAREFAAQLRGLVLEATSKPHKGGAMSRLEKIVESYLAAVESGAPWAVQDFFDRFWGKAKQSIDLETNGPLQTLVEIVHIGAKRESEPTKTSG